MSDWNVMTRTRSGVVSLMKNLTYSEAQGLMQRLRKPWDHGNPWANPAWSAKQAAKADVERERIEKEIKENGSAVLSSGQGYSYYPQGSDLEQIECWGPEGETMVVWPKPETWDEEYGCALNAARLEMGLPL